jgi:NAD(P)-dependent dehydrogenase (short-subunit alcohol dehydrogenase family)
MLRATAEVYATTTDELAGHQLLQRALAPDEVAATIAFCCSPAGAALNGSVVSADGGFS